MPPLAISIAERRALRTRAHALEPVVAISRNGLSDAVLAEIERCLQHHELIKIRVFDDERDERERYFAEICTRLAAAPVQHIGKLLVVWRPAPESAPATKPRRPADKARRSKRSFQGASRS